MHVRFKLFLVVLLFIVTGCQHTAPRPSSQTAPSPPPAKAPSHPPAEDINVRWGVQTNHLDGRFRSMLTLSNEGNTALHGSNWTLYFNFARSLLPESIPPGVQFSRVNGSFWMMTPTDQFAPLPPGKKRTISFEARGSAIKKVDAPAGFYFVFEGADGPALPAEVGSMTVEPFTEERQTDRGRDDDVPVPTPALRYRANAQVASDTSMQQIGRITPTPVLFREQHGSVILRDALTIRHGDGLQQEAAYLAAVLKPVLGVRPTVTAGTKREPNTIVLRRGDVSVPRAPHPTSKDAYTLTVDASDGLQITGASRKGVFYGLQSLRALITPAAYQHAPGPVTLDAVTIRDAPRFGYRGLHLDVARNFQSKAAVKKLLDLMAFYKLDVFQFHLTDDEGWRLPIEELPALTEVGGRRGHPTTLQTPGGRRKHLLPSFGSGPDPDTAASHGSGFYSRAGFEELLRYARDRHITVIPEIDLPGHSRAAIVAMEARHARLQADNRPAAARRYRLQDPGNTSTYRSVQGWANNVVNVCRPSTYRFFETIVSDLQEMYDEANVPLETVHIGGDEVPKGAWEKSPVCQKLIQRNDSLRSVDQLQKYFFKRLYHILKERSLTMAGWHEVALSEKERDNGTFASVPDPYFVDRQVRPYVWSPLGGGGARNTYQLANAGYEVVMSQASHFYLDMAYSKHPQEAGLYWAGFLSTRKPFAFAPFNLSASTATSVSPDLTPLTEEGRANVLGLQGQLWGEALIGAERLEYMAVPHLLALAERAWAVQPSWAAAEDDSIARKRQRNAAWSRFARRLGQRELPRLDYLAGGVAYRLPPPGAILEDGLLKANAAYPGLTIRYSTGGSPPTSASPRYTGPARIENEPVKLRTFSTNGRGSRVVTVPPANP